MKQRNNIAVKVAKELGLSTELVERTYNAYWKGVREHIESLPLKEELTESDYNELQTSINIPSIGKLSCTYPRYLQIKSLFQKQNH